VQTVNLMPRDYARTQRSKRRLMVSAAVMVAALLAMFGLGKLTNGWIAQKERGNALLEGRLNELTVARAELASYNLTLQQLARKHAVIQTIGRNRRWAACLAHIAAAANDEILLTRAHIGPGAGEGGDSPGPKKKAGALTAALPPAEKPKEETDKVRPKKLVLQLEGYALSATDITKFISALSAPGLFERVTFKGSQTAQINRKPLSRFELECPIRYTPRRRARSPGKSRPAQAAPAAEGPALLSSSPAPAEGDGE